MKRRSTSLWKNCIYFTFCSVLGLSFSVVSLAQENNNLDGSITFGAKIGSTVGSFSNQQPHNTSMIGLTSGIFANYSINDQMGLQLEFLYAQDGGRLVNFDMPSLFGDGNWYNLKVNSQQLILHNINVPVLFQYKMALNDLILVASLGPDFAYLIRAEARSESTAFTQDGEFVTFTGNENVTSNIENFNVAGTVGIGIEIPAGGLNITIDGRYRHAFTSSYKSYSYVGIPQIVGDLELRAFSLMLGIEF